MAKSIISEGKTTNEAIEKGLKELNLTRKQVDVKILESEDKRSFFNILTPRVVKVELIVKENTEKIIKKEKLIKGKEAINYILKDFLGKEEITSLLDEYNEKVTKEAVFAYHCDKLECDIQMKLYDQEGCFDLNNQPNNPIINDYNVRKVLDSEKSISNAWIEFDRNKYEDDKNFIEIIEYLKENII